MPYRGNAFRVVYAVQLGDELWVVHAFQKKSTQGIKTPKHEIDLVKDRLKRLKEMLRKKKGPLELVRGSGNIYRDFNVPDADVRQLKAILAAEIIKTLDKKGLSVRKAQSLTGIDAGDFSRVRNADFRRISVERLMTMINGLGSRVEVAVKLSRAEARHATVAP